MAKAKPRPPQRSPASNEAEPTGKVPTLVVDAFGITWEVNAERPSLEWIINAASGLMGWDLLAAVRNRDAAVRAVNELVHHWHRLRAQREKNARLPREEQEYPHLCDGPDDPDKAKWDAPEWFRYQCAEKDLRDGMEVNYWLHHALLCSPERSLKDTYRRLRVIHTLPRVYDHAPEPITPAIWADAKRDYQDILADAYAAAPSAAVAATAGSPNATSFNLMDIAVAANNLALTAEDYNQQPDGHPVGATAKSLLEALEKLERLLNPDGLDFDDPARVSNLQQPALPEGASAKLVHCHTMILG